LGTGEGSGAEFTLTHRKAAPDFLQKNRWPRPLAHCSRFGHSGKKAVHINPFVVFMGKLLAKLQCKMSNTRVAFSHLPSLNRALIRRGFFYCFSSLRLPAVNQCRMDLTNPRARFAEWGYALSKKAGECLSHQVRRHGHGLRLHHPRNCSRLGVSRAEQWCSRNRAPTRQRIASLALLPAAVRSAIPLARQRD